jgi:protein-serine/threonine kinase
MKVVHKSLIVRRNQVQNTKAERDILKLINYPFIVKLHFAF